MSSRLRVRPTHHHHRATARARGPSGYPPKHSFFGAFPPLQSFVHPSYLFASVCACSFCSWFRHSAPIRPIRVIRVKCGLCAARRGGNVSTRPRAAMGMTTTNRTNSREQTQTKWQRTYSQLPPQLSATRRLSVRPVRTARRQGYVVLFYLFKTLASPRLRDSALKP